MEYPNCIESPRQVAILSSSSAIPVAEREFGEVSAQFVDDCAAGLWTWFTVTDGLIANATESVRILSKRIIIRSADALHLSCARDNGLRRVYTNDRHLLLAAPAFGVDAMAI